MNLFSRALLLLSMLMASFPLLAERVVLYDYRYFGPYMVDGEQVRPIDPVAISLNKRLVAGKTLSGILIFGLNDGEFVHSIALPGHITDLAFSTTGESLFTLMDEAVVVYSSVSGERTTVVPLDKLRTPYYLAVAPDGSKVIVGAADNLAIVSLPDHKTSYVPLKRYSTAGAFTPDGKLFIHNDAHQNAPPIVRNAKTLEIARKLEPCAKESPNQIAISRSGLYMAADSSSRLCVWDLASGKIRNRYNVLGDMRALDFVNDDQIMYRTYASGADQPVKILDLRNEKEFELARPEWDVPGSDGRYVFEQGMITVYSELIHIDDIPHILLNLSMDLYLAPIPSLEMIE